jgi:hypothetical protein
MATGGVSDDAAPGRRPLAVDLVRAYEGILLGLVIIVLALVASGGTFGPAEFAAAIVVPGILMVVFIRRGAPPDVFRVRATGAILGWAIIWVSFPVLWLAAYWIGVRGGEYAFATVLAVLDGMVLGLVVAAVDWFWVRLRARRTPA